MPSCSPDTQIRALNKGCEREGFCGGAVASGEFRGAPYLVLAAQEAGILPKMKRQ